MEKKAHGVDQRFLKKIVEKYIHKVQILGYGLFFQMCTIILYLNATVK